MRLAIRPNMDLQHNLTRRAHSVPAAFTLRAMDKEYQKATDELVFFTIQDKGRAALAFTLSSHEGSEDDCSSWLLSTPDETIGGIW